MKIVIIMVVIIFAGCSHGQSEEQMQQLNDLRAEVESLQLQVNTKQDEKSQLEKQISDTDSKIKSLFIDIEIVSKRCFDEPKEKRHTNDSTWVYD